MVRSRTAGLTLGVSMTPDETPAAELWRRTLSQIPSIFGRLAYLSGLRDGNTGKYVHFGFAQRFSEKEADRTLQRSHRNMFDDWLSFSLEQQKEDLDRYLDGLDQDRKVVLQNWRVFPPFANLVPASAKDAERELFLSDLRIVLHLLR